MKCVVNPDLDLNGIRRTESVPSPTADTTKRISLKCQKKCQSVKNNLRSGSDVHEFAGRRKTPDHIMNTLASVSVETNQDHVNVKATFTGQSDGNVVANSIRGRQLEGTLNVSTRIRRSAFGDLLSVSVDSHDGITCLVERVEDPAANSCLEGTLEVTKNSVRRLIYNRMLEHE